MKVHPHHIPFSSSEITDEEEMEKYKSEVIGKYKETVFCVAHMNSH